MKYEKDVDLETILGEINIFGRYHFKLFILLGIASLLGSAHCTNYIFAVENVDYSCKYTQCGDEQVVSADPSVDLSCRKYELVTEDGICTVKNASMSEPCDQWTYEKPDSFVAEFNLACQDWKRTLIGTLHSAGYMVGLFMVGPISDKIGRKKLIIFNAVAGGVVGLIKSLVSSYWVFALLEFVEPLIGDSYSATHTMAVEMVTIEYRSLAMSTLSLTSGLGGMLMAICAWRLPNWRNFLQAIYAPSLLSIFYIFLLDESFRWLLNKGKKEELTEAIKNAAKLNKKTIDDKRLLNLKCEDQQQKIKQITILKITLTSKTLIRRLICCIFMWFTTLFGAYVLTINSVSLEGDKYLNYALLSLSELPATVILYYLLQKCKRKMPIVTTLVMTSVFCMGNALTPFEYKWLSITLFICGRMSVVLAIRILYLYTSELFPTYTRNTMHAWCSAMGRIAAVLAPQTPLLIPYWAGLPSLLVAMLSLLTACTVSFMPDTSEDILPDNIKQAEALGQRENENKIYSISTRL